MQRYLAKDYVETPEGLLFALLSDQLEDERLPACLRYVRSGDALRKLPTDEANQLLKSTHPEYLYYSRLRDTQLHGVPPPRIQHHCRARDRADAMQREEAGGALQEKCRRAIALLTNAGIASHQIGVTGSLLVNAHHDRSDIDLVIYDRAQFSLARDAVRHATANGGQHVLNETVWRETYRRRKTPLSFDEFVWHERRKYNKLVMDGTKVDISLVVPASDRPRVAWNKIAESEIVARVVDDRQAFDFPASLQIDHPTIAAVIIYTHTYVGQAFSGEWIHARGWLETSAEGQTRMLIGTSREAHGQYLRVTKRHDQ